jgi:AcrR family transcriptional regulator
MPAPVRVPRERWTDAGLRALAAHGSTAVRVETLAATLGVTKGSFYWHFRNREELLGAILDAWEEALVDRAIASADAGGGDGRTRLRRLFRAAEQLDDLLELELSVRDWARRDPAVAERVTRVDRRRLDYLRPLFAEFCDDAADVEGRCLLVLTLLVGDALLSATGSGRRRGRRSASAAALRHVLR